MQEYLDNPTNSANHMVFGMNKDQRAQANLIKDNKSVHTWVWASVRLYREEKGGLVPQGGIIAYFVDNSSPL